MRLLVGSEVKQEPTEQNLIKAVKPKSVIPPLLFGLGVEMDPYEFWNLREGGFFQGWLSCDCCQTM